MSSKMTSTGSEGNATESTEKTAKNTASTKRMGLVRFLQVKPQKSGIAAIMKRRYASEVHTQAEWETLVEYILNRKVK